MKASSLPCLHVMRVGLANLALTLGMARDTHTHTERERERERDQTQGTHDLTKSDPAVAKGVPQSDAGLNSGFSTFWSNLPAHDRPHPSTQHVRVVCSAVSPKTSHTLSAGAQALAQVQHLPRHQGQPGRPRFRGGELGGNKALPGFLSRREGEIFSWS